MFRVTLIGTGAPPPILSRFGPCTLVEVGRVDDARQLAAEVIRIDPAFTATDYQGAIFKDSAISKRIVANLLKAGIPK